LGDERLAISDADRLSDLSAVADEEQLTFCPTHADGKLHSLTLSRRDPQAAVRNETAFDALDLLPNGGLQPLETFRRPCGRSPVK
jgi:hypothetical protein